MRSFAWCVFFCALLICQRSNAEHYEEDDDDHVNEYIEYCLAEYKIDIATLGVSRIEDIYGEHIQKIPKEKLGCFVACVFKKRQFIAQDNQVVEHMPSTAQNLNGDHCRGETDFCKLGDCLYKVYFY